MASDSESPVSLPARRVAAWLDLMRTTDRLLLAGLARKVGPQGDVREAYRRWYADQMREHDEVVRRVVQRLSANGQETGHAR